MIFDIEDMRYFADRHRGKYKNSGPHWSLVNRFPMLFDEYEKVSKENDRFREQLQWRTSWQIPDREGNYLCDLGFGEYKVCSFRFFGNWGTSIGMRLLGWLPIPPKEVL